MRKLLLIPAFLVAFAIACGGGGGTADLTDREITDEELSLMVLSLLELGSQYADFELDEEDSGFQSSEDAIEDAFDEDDEAEDVQRFGRVNGYSETYFSLEALLEGEGAFFISTVVTLYEDADGASGDLKDGSEDALRAIGTTDDDITLEDASEFDPDGIGDESAGLVLTLSASGGQELTFYGTIVGFTRGRLLGAVFIGRFDDEDVREETAALARELEERILAVLQGGL